MCSYVLYFGLCNGQVHTFFPNVYHFIMHMASAICYNGNGTVLAMVDYRAIPIAEYRLQITHTCEYIGQNINEKFII